MEQAATLVKGMKVLVHQKDLLSAVYKAGRARSNKKTIPILGCAYLEARDGKLTVRCTDLESLIQVTVPAQVEGEGVAVLPWATLYRILCHVPKEHVALEVDDKMRTATLRWGFSRYRLYGFDPEQYPGLPDIGGSSFTVDAADLRLALRRTAYAVSKDLTRPWITGVHLVGLKDRVRLLAVDGVRIAWATLPVQAPEVNVILSGAGLLTQFLPQKPGTEARVSIDDTHLTVEVDGLLFRSRSIDGEFPDVMRLIPSNPAQTKATVNRMDLLMALRRVPVLSWGGTALFTFKGDTLTLSGKSEEVGDLEEAIPCTLEGGPLETGFNCAFLADALAPWSCERVELLGYAPRHPVRIRPAGEDTMEAVVLPIITY